MSKIAIISDLHLGERKFRKQIHSQNAWKIITYNVFQGVIDKVKNDNNIDSVIIAGDVFDHFNPDIDAIFMAQKLADINKPCYIISGNHDKRAISIEYDIHCFDIMSQISGFGASIGPYWIKEPTEKLFTKENDGENIHMFFLPYGYLTPEWFAWCSESIGKNPGFKNILIAHGYIDVDENSNVKSEKKSNGEEINNPYVIPKHFASQFQFIITGHVHIPNLVGNSRSKIQILTPGSLMPSSAILASAREDGLPDKFKPQIWYYDTEKNKVTSEYIAGIPTFHNIFTDNANDVLDSIKDNGVWYINTSESITAIDEAIYKKALESSLHLHLVTNEIVKDVKDDNADSNLPSFWDWVKEEHSDWEEDFRNIIQRKEGA